MPVCVGLWRSFLDYRKNLLTIFATLNLILNKFFIFIKNSPKIPFPVLARCDLLLFRFYGLCVIYEEDIIFDAKTFQVAIYFNTFLVIFLLKILNQWNSSSQCQPSPLQILK